MAPPAPSLATAEQEPALALTREGTPGFLGRSGSKRCSRYRLFERAEQRPRPLNSPRCFASDSWKGFFCELPFSLNFVGIYSNAIFQKICGKNYSVSQGTSAVLTEGNRIRPYSLSCQANT